MQNAAKLNELPEELRGRKRSRIRLSALLQAGGESRKVNLLNLSTGGALLDAETPPAVDTEAVLTRGEARASGRIMWVNEHRFGMAFDEPLDEALILDQFQAATPKDKVTPSR